MEYERPDRAAGTLRNRSVATFHTGLGDPDDGRHIESRGAVRWLATDLSVVAGRAKQEAHDHRTE